MAFKFTPEAQARIDQYRNWEAERKAEIGALTDENLVTTAKFYMSHMSPMKFVPGEPVYDATMWHIILPELMKRISNG